VSCARSIARLQEAALHGADEDADHFKQYLQHRDAVSAEELRLTDLTLLGLCQSLSEIVERISADIHPIVAGDITAARALLAAAAAIHQQNSAAT
jgi:hypothetical protein